MREHIHHAGRQQFPAAFPYEQRSVAGQRCRIAGNINQTSGTLIRVRERAAKRHSAFTRRIDQNTIHAAKLVPDGIPIVQRPVKQVTSLKFSLVCEIIVFCTCTGTINQFGASLDTENFC